MRGPDYRQTAGLPCPLGIAYIVEARCRRLPGSSVRVSGFMLQPPILNWFGVQTPPTKALKADELVFYPSVTRESFLCPRCQLGYTCARCSVRDLDSAASCLQQTDL
jgi:hypothetical protein